MKIKLIVLTQIIRRMEKGNIFEIVINWSEQAIDFSLESGSSLVTSPSGTEVDDIKNPRLA